MKNLLKTLLIFIANNLVPLLWYWRSYQKYENKQIFEATYFLLVAILWKLLFSI